MTGIDYVQRRGCNPPTEVKVSIHETETGRAYRVVDMDGTVVEFHLSFFAVSAMRATERELYRKKYGEEES